MLAKAQIPNSSFETWSNGPNSVPDGWRSGSNVVQRSTDHFSGNYSAMITTSINGTDTARGQMETGTVTDTNGNPKPAFPVSQRHTSFKGYYKYNPVNGDSANLGCMLFKNGYSSGYPGALPGMLGFAFQTFGGSVSTFTPFSIDFGYFDNTLVPDSGWAILSAYVFYRGTNTNLRPLGNSVLYVDAVSFDTYATGIQQVNDITNSFKLMPNANNGKFQIQYDLKDAGFTTLKIYDMNGHELRNLGSGNFVSGHYTQDCDATELAKGNYLIVLSGENGFHSEELVIAR